MSGRSPPEGYLGTEGRITSGPAPELVEAGFELEIDDADILHRGLSLADLAHVLTLHEAGVVPDGDVAEVLSELLSVLRTPAAEFPYDAQYGDAYNAREKVLEDRLGRTAGWVHTGRTRREAGRIAFRVELRRRLLDLHDAVSTLATTIADRADELADAVWADTTYLQPAQPSTFGHYLGGFLHEAVRHLDRLAGAHRWADRSPAGVGAVGGTRIPLDRSRLATLLGFAEPAAHTRDAMWSTDGLVDAVVAATQSATTVDRLAEDLEILSSPQFGYVELDASTCRASVAMPQKKNPYALVVIRGGTNTLIGRATGMLSTQRTPSARTDNWLHSYGEVIGALRLGRRLADLGAQVVGTLHVDRQRLRSLATTGFTTATDVAELLVLQHGLDYRSAYRLTGQAVRLAMEENRSELRQQDLARAADSADLELGDPASIRDALDADAVIATRTTVGGAAPERVRDHAREQRRQAQEAARWARDRRREAQTAEQQLVEAATARVRELAAD